MDSLCADSYMKWGCYYIHSGVASRHVGEGTCIGLQVGQLSCVALAIKGSYMSMMTRHNQCYSLVITPHLPLMPPSVIIMIG